MLRHQLPVYSPVGISAVLAGFASALTRDSAIAELENRLKRGFSATSVVLCGSGTQALQFAITMLRQTASTDAIVALPAFNCYDVASAAIGAGAPVSLYDIDADTLTPDLESLERCLVTGARIVVAASLYGVPVPWDPLAGLCAKYGATLVEDAAQGHGATWRGHVLGSLAEVSTISFGRGKGWTGGAGGAVLMRGKTAFSPLLRTPGSADDVKNLVKLSAQEVLGRPGLYGVPRAIPGLRLGETTYHAPVEPHGITRSSAAALLATERASNAEPNVRRRHAEQLLAMITETDRLRKISVATEGVPGYLRLPLRLSGGMSAVADVKHAEALGIAPSYPIPLVELEPLRARLISQADSFPGARRLAADLVTAPVHSRVTLRDLQNIANLLKRASA